MFFLFSFSDYAFVPTILKLYLFFPDGVGINQSNEPILGKTGSLYNNFVCWQDKMMLLLTALEISYILDPAFKLVIDSKMVDGKEITTVETKQVEKKKKQHSQHAIESTL